MKLLGFDAREMWLPFEDEWPDDRRRVYCLRDSLVKVLSTDDLVWPSVFRLCPGLRTPSRETVVDAGLCAGVGAVIDCVTASPGLGGLPAWVIAVTLADEVCAPMKGGTWDPDRETAPAQVGPGWRLLGYDVSDRWLLSGLSNCGYVPTDAVDADGHDTGWFRETWGSKLNEYHLFANSADAGAFRHVTDVRVAEHAPFFVYGLWLVKELGDVEHGRG